MKLYYRISDNSYPKAKLIGTNKEVCLMNFLKAFVAVIYGKEKPKEDHVPPVSFICDNCERTTVKMIHSTGLPYTITAEGNAGALWKSLVLALEECEDDDLVYFCEDDFLHLGSAPQLLEEGIKHADYVTLYDHPDKYTGGYNGGEFSKVIKTASSHWRYTVSTVMTFGTKVGTLKEDISIWEKYTSEEHPHDHHIFTELNDKDRQLAVCIPGVACHTDMTFSSRVNYMTIEPWAIDLMIRHISDECQELAVLKGKANEYMQVTQTMIDKTKSEQLLAFAAIKDHFSKLVQV